MRTKSQPAASPWQAVCALVHWVLVVHPKYSDVPSAPYVAVAAHCPAAVRGTMVRHKQHVMNKLRNNTPPASNYSIGSGVLSRLSQAIPHSRDGCFCW